VANINELMEKFASTIDGAMKRCNLYVTDHAQRGHVFTVEKPTGHGNHIGLSN